MFRKISSQSVPVTTELAVSFRDMKPCPGDRPLNTARLKAIRIEVADRMFSSCVWAYAKCKEDGECYRVNGKHTSTEFSDNLPDYPVEITVEVWECDRLQDVKNLYATFDSREAARTQSDVNAAIACGEAGLEDIDLKTLNVLVGGVWFRNHRGAKPGGHTARERSECIRTEKPFFKWFKGMQEGKGAFVECRKKFLRVPVVAAMYETWSFQPQLATEFWSLVRDETGASPDQADRTLGRFLDTAYLRSEKNKYAASANAREVYAKCIQAFNAWKRQRPLKTLRYTPGTELPIAS